MFSKTVNSVYRAEAKIKAAEMSSQRKLDQTLLITCRVDRFVLEDSSQSGCKMVIQFQIYCTYLKNVY